MWPSGPPNGTSGDAAPLASISGSNTGLFFPEGLAVDASGDLFVANGGGSILEFGPGANGNATPIATISGPTSGVTGANSPFGIALDPSGDIFVSLLNNSVAEFAPGSNGDVAPVATLAGSSTDLSQPDGVAIAFGTLYVANTDDSLTEYPLSAIHPGTNNLVPSALIAGAATGIDNPQGIGVDGSGNAYVVNYVRESASSVTGFAPTANGDAAPATDITGASTGLETPAFVAVPPQAASSSLAVTTPGLPDATSSAPYYRYLAATGGTVPYTWTVNGSLPPGQGHRARFTRRRWPAAGAARRTRGL